jgi:hypothetical protein
LKIRRARTRIAAGDYAKAADEARVLAADPKAGAELLDGAARVLALAAGAAKSEPGIAAKDAADTVAILRRGLAAGQYRTPGSAEKLRNDSDFAAIKNRDDFRKFVGEIGK